MGEASDSTNIWTAKYYGIAMGAIMVLFVSSHWGGIIYRSYRMNKPAKPSTRLTQYQRAVQRSLNTVVLGISLDKWVLYLTFWAIQVILILTNNDLSSLEAVARRLGWISVSNLTLLVFLALKHTPLAPLSGHSYEKLRPLHKIAGYTCILTSVLHGITFLKEAADAEILYYMKTRKDLTGAIAGLSMVIIGCSTITWFSRRHYEAFYIIHLVLFLLILILIGFHRPKFSSKTLIVIILIACMWFTDRALRFIKMTWNFFGNYATLTPMSDGAVRVRLHRSIRCKPGSHAFLWMPSIRFFESHPFTLVSSEPVEFLIRKYDGYTNDLYKLAHERPGQTVRCSVDGGYGQVPDFMNFDKVVLVSGGSGASFTFAIALDLIKRCTEANIVKPIDFIWTVRYQSSLKWFEDELRVLQNCQFVNLRVHVSQDDTSSDMSTGGSSPSTSNEDMEKGGEKLSAQESYTPFFYRGRPNISMLVTDCIAQCSLHSRVGVGACGPLKIIETTREATSQPAFDIGPSVSLHTEEFDW